MNHSPQETIEHADRLYAAREEKKCVRQSIELLQPLAAVGDYEATWRICRALFFLGQEAPDKAEARRLHKEAVTEGERAINTATNRVENYFWLGVNLALLAEIENAFSAAPHALRAKRLLSRAAEINPAYHGAGPLRVLAKLSHKLPMLLGGNTKQARILFKRAIELAPSNTVTRIYFAEMLLETGDATLAHAQLQALLDAPLDPAWAFETKRDRRLARELLQRMKLD